MQTPPTADLFLGCFSACSSDDTRTHHTYNSSQSLGGGKLRQDGSRSLPASLPTAPLPSLPPSLPVRLNPKPEITSVI